jgi:[acyl-carrier-protein] S-malonyltransferase
VATWIALSQRLPDPDVLLGYSVGEMSAYGCAGIWTPQQFAALVAQRADLMDQAAPKNAGLMAVKGMTRALTDALCISFKLANAIIVADDHVILGGMRRDLANAEEEITNRGFWCQILDVAVPAHTPMMSGAVYPFRSLVQSSAMTPSLTPVLAGINGCPTTTVSKIADTLAAQLMQPVDWQACMQSVVERGVTVVLEVGPGKNLAKMFNELGNRIESRSCEDFRTLDGIEKWIKSRCN